MLNNMLHETVLELPEIADNLLIKEISEISEDQSICSDIENEIYALVHFGSSKSHTITHLKKLQPVESSRYFQCTTVCYRCNQTGHMARDCVKSPQTCFLCNKTDHKKSNCPKYICRKCKRMGHNETACNSAQQKRVECSHCYSRSHQVNVCPMSTQSQKSTEIKLCNGCGSKKHFLSECPNVQQKRLSQPSNKSSAKKVALKTEKTESLETKEPSRDSKKTKEKKNKKEEPSRREKEKEEDAPKKGKKKNTKK
ncbi:hypothetical protein NEMIN01_1837 [Nematocida minor]|uniref:uncharacterized protein n=1 Tax=Nematocida minor TaxID=1912983 RepID=UPI002220AD90|nr:uncharacterized protein NEMIN01_1837 [Nematocida minor]KAI5192144.1 hypothetical protein NEMIN01_1837 [Nematocida minor]